MLVPVKVGIFRDVIIIDNYLFVFVEVGGLLVDVLCNAKYVSVSDLRLGEELTITIDDSLHRNDSLVVGDFVKYMSREIASMTDFLHSQRYDCVGFYPGTSFVWYVRKGSKIVSS